MPIEPWFPLAIYYTDLENAAAQKDSLVSNIIKLEEKSYKKRIAPDIAWTGDFHGAGHIHKDPNFAWIVKQLETHTLLFLEELGVDISKLDLYIQRAWPVVSRAEQTIPAHRHHTSHVSAVYYVSVPESGTTKSGAFTIYNDAGMNEIIKGIGGKHTDAIKRKNPFNYEQGFYAPTEGRLLIFPSKQRHSVEVNKTGETRISLSFDIVITSAETEDPGLYEFLCPPPSVWKKFEQN
jgi:uncharacterized protein (TIGR02466 family)